MPGTNGGSHGPQKPGKSTSSPSSKGHSHPSPKRKSHPSSKGKSHPTKSHPSSTHPKQSTDAQKARSAQSQDNVKKEHAVHFPADGSTDSSLSLHKSVSVGKERQVVKKPQTPANQRGSPAKKSPSPVGGSEALKSKKSTPSGAGRASVAVDQSRFGLPGVIYRSLQGTRKKRASSTVSSQSASQRSHSQSSSQSQHPSSSPKGSSSSSGSRESKTSSGSAPKGLGANRPKSSVGNRSKSPSGSSSKSRSSRKSRPKPKTEERQKVSFGYAVAFQEASESHIAVVVLPVRDSMESTSQIPAPVPQLSVPHPDETPAHGILLNKNEKPPKGPYDPSSFEERKPRKPLQVVLHEQFCTPRVISYILGAVIVAIIVIVVVVVVKLLVRP